MADQVYKVVEVVGSSESSISKAIEAAVKPPPPNYGFHYDKQIAKLRKAIEARNTKFRYTPCRHSVVEGRDVEDDRPDNWEFLVDYE